MSMSEPIEGYMDRIRREAAEQKVTNKEDLELLSNRLKALGIEKVDITFDGGGDEGYIDEVRITLIDKDKNVDDSDLNNVIETWAYDFLELSGVDWYNNEGGFGHIKISVVDNKLSYEINQRVTTYELADSGEEDI